MVTASGNRDQQLQVETVAREAALATTIGIPPCRWSLSRLLQIQDYETQQDTGMRWEGAAMHVPSPPAALTLHHLAHTGWSMTQHDESLETPRPPCSALP